MDPIWNSLESLSNWWYGKPQPNTTAKSTSTNPVRPNAQNTYYSDPIPNIKSSGPSSYAWNNTQASLPSPSSNGPSAFRKQVAPPPTSPRSPSMYRPPSPSRPPSNPNRTNGASTPKSPSPYPQQKKPLPYYSNDVRYSIDEEKGKSNHCCPGVCNCCCCCPKSTCGKLSLCIVIIALLVAIAVLTYFYFPRKPDIKVKSVVLADPNNPFTLTLPGQNPDNPGLSLGMLLNMTISVASDNAYSLTISNISLTAALVLSGSKPQIGSGSIVKPVTFNAHSTTLFPIPFDIVYTPPSTGFLTDPAFKEIMSACGALPNISKHPLAIEYTAEISVPVISSLLNYHPSFSDQLKINCPSSLQSALTTLGGFGNLANSVKSS